MQSEEQHVEQSGGPVQERGDTHPGPPQGVTGELSEASTGGGSVNAPPAGEPLSGEPLSGEPAGDEPPPEVIYLTPGEAAGIAMMSGILPLFLSVAHAMEEGYAESEPMATNLIGLLERNAQELHEESERDGLWTAAAALCRAVFLEHHRALDLIERTKELDRHAGYAWKTLCALSYLGASVDKYAIPALRVSLHMAIAEFVCAGTSRIPELYSSVVVPWFETYWLRTFERMRFRFQTPKLVEMDLRAARDSDPSVRVQRILRSVAFGLNVALPERGREWFERA